MANLDDPGYDPYTPATYTPSSSISAGASPSADITVAPGYTPDYGSLLQSDPGLTAAKSAADASQQSADAARRAAVRGQYVQYGGDLPQGWTDQYGDIDQATQDAAKANQFSTIANLHTNYAQSVDQFKKALAARGALQSSELNYGQDQLDRGLGQQQYDAANAFTNSLAGDYSGYAGVLGQNARDLASAVGSAQSNVFNNPANRPVAPTTAHYDTSLSAQYGKPVYTDGWGTVYDQFGNVLQAGTPPPPPAPAPAPAPTGGGGGGGFDGYTDSSLSGSGDPYSAATMQALQTPLDPNGNIVTQNYAPYQAGSTPTQYNSTQDAARALASAYSYTPPPISGYSQKSKANIH